VKGEEVKTMDGANMKSESPCINGKRHKWRRGHHRLFCTRCGVQRPQETCKKVVTMPEPAGTSSLLCGHFEMMKTKHIKRLWDQLRLSLAYQPQGDEAVATPDPPQWFVEEWMAGMESADG
jgi:hypothetical protein